MTLSRAQGTQGHLWPGCISEIHRVWPTFEELWFETSSYWFKIIFSSFWCCVFSSLRYEDLAVPVLAGAALQTQPLEHVPLRTGAARLLCSTLTHRTWGPSQVSVGAALFPFHPAASYPSYSLCRVLYLFYILTDRTTFSLYISSRDSGVFSVPREQCPCPAQAICPN